jgi:hypothetical protein
LVTDPLLNLSRGRSLDKGQLEEFRRNGKEDVAQIGAAK